MFVNIENNNIFQTTTTMADRPIVVNSLLCFIHNFRSHPHLEVLTRSYFSKCVNDVARQNLIEILTDNSNSKNDSNSINQNASILELFDKAATILNPSPLFVAADLTSLPMVLIGDQNQSKNVVDEIHQLRWFIQSIFTGNEYKKLPSCYFSALSNTSTTTSSTEKEEATSEDRASPINLSTRHSTSPRLLSVVVSEPQVPEQQLQRPSNNDVVGDIENMDSVDTVLSQPPSPQISSRKASPNKKSSPRKHAPYRLNQAVRKLTDRLVAEANKDGVISPGKSSPPPPPKSVSPNKSFEISNNISSVENEKPAATVVEINSLSTPVTSNELAFLHHQQNLNGTVMDPFALMMLRNFANASKQQQIIPKKNNRGPKKGYRKNNNVPAVMDAISVDAGSLDEIMDDEDDKMMSNESSPTPSDSSNGGGNGKNGCYDKNDDNEGDKPFTCGQPNCSKRFANKFLLKKHQFIHTGLRPHICPYCAKRFNRKDNLLRHKKTHLANATLPMDGRRRHHALLAPATLSSGGTFDPLTLLQISQAAQQNNNEKDLILKVEEE